MRQMEESPTRASTRATTRIAMLNKISDRMQQSQEEYHPLHIAASTQSTQNVGPFSQNTQGGERVLDRGSPDVRKISRRSASLRYGIGTLIELGSRIEASSDVLLKIKPEAIAENLFQYMGIDRSLRPPARSRGLSDVTNLSRRSMMSSSGMNDWEPTRQPRAAPRAADSKNTSFLQQHEGFIRFLKQHASPPHHRVTAGGRIVPTGPLSPPPMFDYASLNGLLESQPNRVQVPMGASINLQDQRGPESGLAPSQFNGRTTYAGFQTNQVPTSQVMDSGMGYSPLPFMNPVGHSMPSSFALTPLGIFPDGTALISCNGVCYRCYWNGVTTVMEPLTTGQPFLVPNEATVNDFSMPVDRKVYPSPGYGDTAPPTLSQPLEAPVQETSATLHVENSRRAEAPFPVGSSHSEASSLKAQLTSLDKYMALHHFDIGPSVKIQLVSRRKSLVEAIAKCRSDTRPSIPTMPIVSTSIGGSRKSSAKSLVGRLVTETQPQSKNDFQIKNAKENTTLKKSLSPSAPAFIPKSFATSVAASNPSLVPISESGPLSRKRDPSDAMETAGDGFGDSVKNENSVRKVSLSSEETAYEIDPWDPAMKIVPPSMIEYAQKCNPSNPSVGKKFCTTKEEFQEAIRRVREQARMWGCVGGNSKDPAYDAEEDIWYAIKDEYPIPLPTATPDHITCPRPWNWYDSAFNVNATSEPKVNMGNHSLEKMRDQPQKTAPAKNPSMSISVTKTRHSELAKVTNDPVPSKVSLHQTMRDDRKTTERGSGSLPDRYANEQRWQNPRGQYFQSNDVREERPRNFSSQKDSQHRYKASLSKMKEIANKRVPDAAKPPDHVTQTYNFNAKDAGPLSQLALSAAQAVYSPTGVKQGHTFDAVAYPKTPSSSPTKTKSGNLCDEMPTQLTTTPIDQAAIMRTNIPNRNVEPQPVITSPVSLSAKQSLRKVSHKLIEQEPLSWNNLALSESKGTWGPEQSSLTPGNGDAPQVRIPKTYPSGYIRPSESYQNLPQVHNSMQAAVDPSFNFGHLASPADTHSKPFLKEMLRDPRYSLNEQHSYLDSVKAGTSVVDLALLENMAQSQNEHSRAQEVMACEQRSHQIIDKENMTNAYFRDYVDAFGRIESHEAESIGSNFGPFPTAQVPASPSISKAGFSMAATTYHARGILPSYDGAGVAQTTSIRQNQSNRISRSRPRVNLPLSSSGNQSYNSSEQSKQRTIQDHSSQGQRSRYMPAIFGYDGSEGPAVDDKGGKKQERPEGRRDESTDGKKVTTADFDNHQPDHDNEWHRGAVNDFFRDLHEKEVKHMMARQRKNTKTAP